MMAQASGSLEMPRLFRVRQRFDDTCLDDAAGALRAELDRSGVLVRVKPGMEVALAVGSRGIRGLAALVRALGERIRERGALPFVVPAMGSHGGATAEGQAAVLAGYGVTPGGVDMEIRSSMDVVPLGRTASGVPVHIDALAHAADLIVPVNRVKPHTDFWGPVGSGLCKMLSVGLGNHVGCAALHRRGFEAFPALIPEAAAFVIEHARVGFGVAVVENAYDKTLLLRAIPAERILQEEPGLLALAQAHMPGILLPEIDLLIVRRFGKDLSGTGMDPNVTGRALCGTPPGFSGPAVRRILVESLTPLSHGNACSIGMADYLLSSCFRQVDWQVTHLNAVASGCPEGERVPRQVARAEDVLPGLMAERGMETPDRLRVVRIDSTLDLGVIEASEALLPQVRADGRLDLLD